MKNGHGSGGKHQWQRGNRRPRQKAVVADWSVAGDDVGATANGRHGTLRCFLQNVMISNSIRYDFEMATLDWVRFAVGSRPTVPRSTNVVW